MRDLPESCPLPHDLPERVFAARGWLSQVSARFRQQILEAAIIRTFAAGQAIAMAGQEGGGPYGLLQGRVGCWGSSPLAESVLGHVAVPGDWFGHGPVQQGGERSMSFRALEHSVLLYLPANRLWQLSPETPEFGQHMARLSETSAQLMVGLIADLLVPEASRRLAAVLVKAARFELDFGLAAEAPLPLGQSALAELSCLSRPHVNRILKSWASAGLVETGYNRIRPLSVRRLGIIASGRDNP